MKESHQPECFVIMPFKVREADLVNYHNDAEHWREVYEGLISPAIRKAGLHPERDDNDYAARLVAEGIWSKIERAALVLCDMSSHNPNVHLELGWALRSDKKIVLIKDEVTAFSFDLNQYFTFQYSSRLQPVSLKDSIDLLARVIGSTLEDEERNYSIVSKISLQERATKAVTRGNVEVEMLQELLGEVRTLRTQIAKVPGGPESRAQRSLNVKDPSLIAEALRGTTWRKKNGLEEIFFISTEEFSYTSVGMQRWINNDFHIELPGGRMVLEWRHDGYIAECRFNVSLNEFREDNGEQWYLVASEPYLHPSFKGRM